VASSRFQRRSGTNRRGLKSKALKTTHLKLYNVRLLQIECMRAKTGNSIGQAENRGGRDQIPEKLSWLHTEGS